MHIDTWINHVIQSLGVVMNSVLHVYYRTKQFLRDFRRWYFLHYMHAYYGGPPIAWETNCGNFTLSGLITWKCLGCLADHLRCGPPVAWQETHVGSHPCHHCYVGWIWLSVTKQISIQHMLYNIKVICPIYYRNYIHVPYIRYRYGWIIIV